MADKRNNGRGPGRPRGRSVTAQAREAMRLLQDLSVENVQRIQHACDHLEAMSHDPTLKANDRIAAAKAHGNLRNAQLDRGLGKPALQIVHSNEETESNPRELPRAEQIAILRGRLQAYQVSLAELEAEEAAAVGGLQ